MSSVVPEDDTSQQPDDEWDLDGEWAQARKRSGLDPNTYEGTRDKVSAPLIAVFSPYLLLYSGFLLGPLATVFLAAVATGRRRSPRQLAVLIGVGGTIWCAIHGLTHVLLPIWPTFHVQIVRSVMNLVLGVILLFVIRSWSTRTIVHNRQTLTRTAVVFGLMVMTYYMWKASPVLVFLGR